MKRTTAVDQTKRALRLIAKRTTAASERLDAVTFARLNGKNVIVSLYSLGGNELATLAGKIKIDPGSFVFEVKGSKAKISFPYRKPDKATMTETSIGPAYVIDEKNLKWIIRG